MLANHSITNVLSPKWRSGRIPLTHKTKNQSFEMCTVMCQTNICREKERYLTQSYDESPHANRKFNNQLTAQKRPPPKKSIKKRMRTDLGRSVGVSTAIQLVWLNWVLMVPTFPLTRCFCDMFMAGRVIQTLPIYFSGVPVLPLVTRITWLWVKISAEETRPWSTSPLIVCRDSFSIGPKLTSRRAEHSLLWRISLCIFEILFLSTWFLLPLLFGWPLVLALYEWGLFAHFLNVCLFDCKAFAVRAKVGIP